MCCETTATAVDEVFVELRQKFGTETDKKTIWICECFGNVTRDRRSEILRSARLGLFGGGQRFPGVGFEYGDEGSSITGLAWIAVRRSG